MSAFVLGLDGGGTKVVAEVATPDGVELGRGIGGACNIAVMSVEDALASAMGAATAALAEAGVEARQIQAVCAGVAGASFTERCLAFHGGLEQGFSLAKVEVLPDYAIAHTAALGGAPGVIVIAGTGSIAYGETDTGLSHRTGGYGYLIDDAGSGYGVAGPGLPPRFAPSMVPAGLPRCSICFSLAFPCVRRRISCLWFTAARWIA